MLTRIRSVTAVVTFATVLCLAGTTPAQAPLGLSIDPNQGLPGTVVDAVVDPDDVAANCPADPTALLDAVFAVLTFLVEDTAFISQYFPGGMIGDTEDYDAVGYYAVGQVLLGIFFDTPAGTTQTAFEQTFVLTFANIATQDPVGELSTFDPATGTGSVVTPDVACGPWAVAAACVLPEVDTTLLMEAIEGAGALLEAAGFPLEPPDPFDPETQAFYVANAAAIIQPIFVPQSLGVQIFNVLCEPQSKDECKKGGWEQFNVPPPGLGFRNQGDCIHFFNTGQVAGTTAATTP